MNVLVRQIGLTCWLALVPLVPATAFAQNDEATAAYVRGKQLLDRKSYEEALTEMRRAYDLSKSPNASLGVAVALHQLGKRVEAARQYRETVEVAGADATYDGARVKAREELEALEAELARVELTLTRTEGLSTATARFDDEAFDVEPGQSLIEMFEPGESRVHVEADGFDAHDESLVLRAGERHELTIALQPTRAAVLSDADTQGGVDWLVPATLAAGGVATVGWAMFIGFGVSNRNIRASLEERCAPRRPT